MPSLLTTKGICFEHLIYRSPGLGAATAANNSAVSTQGNNNVGVTQENVPTSDSSVLLILYHKINGKVKIRLNNTTLPDNWRQLFWQGKTKKGVFFHITCTLQGKPTP